MKKVYLDLHVIQTVPPSNVNRDDTGSPKTAYYGGVNRSRVSSQSWKKAVRDYFKETLPEGEIGVRSKKVLQLVEDEIKALDPDLNAREVAEQMIKHTKVKLDKDGETGALFFMSPAQAKVLAKMAVERPELTQAKIKKSEENEIQEALRAAPSVDMALFGRMVADNASLNVDAAAQVAHAISTHDVTNEYDYFTAVDDIDNEDHAGAAHIGTVEYNSSTLYRYANVAVHDLHKYLKDDTFRGVEAFIEAFVKSMPTGKQNTFANWTMPDGLVIAIREDQPINMVGAFERAVPASDKGYVEPSIKRLVEQCQKIYSDFAGEPTASFVVGEGLDALGTRGSLQASIDAAMEALKRIAQPDED